MTINQLIDDVLDEFEIHKPYKDFDLPLGEAVTKTPTSFVILFPKKLTMMLR